MINNQLPKITIAVHDGIFHADEVFAIAGLSYLYNINLIRTRDESRLAKADMRVDVGGRYNHDTKDYDHHMAGFSERHESPNKFRYDDGPKRSGVGLIFKHYGRDIIRAILRENIPNENPNDTEIDDIYKNIDRSLIATIDCIDNGETDYFRFRECPYTNANITRFISMFNPSGDDQSPDTQQIQFNKAVDIAKTYLSKEIIITAENVLNVKHFEALVENMKDEDAGILIMEKFIPWGYAYSRIGSKADGIQMVVYPNVSGTWMCQTPKYYYTRHKHYFPDTLQDGKKRRYISQAPEDICGLRDNELIKITRVPDAVFVHSSGHLGAARSKEGAIKLANYFIMHRRM